MSAAHTSDPARACRTFIDGRRNLMLATVDPDGTPRASQAPFVLDAGAFHVLVSALAGHAANLGDGAPAAVLLAADEGETAEAFARRRVSFQCRSETVTRDSDEWRRITALFRDRFGEVVDTLCALADFRLVRLTPEHGTWVTGFGQAWRIEGFDLERLTPLRRGT